MIDANADSHDIQQRKSVLAESEAMIPEVQNLYKKAVADLAKFLKDAGASAEITASPSLKDAQSILEENGIVFDKIAPAEAAPAATTGTCNAVGKGTTVRHVIFLVVPSKQSNVILATEKSIPEENRDRNPEKSQDQNQSVPTVSLYTHMVALRISSLAGSTSLILDMRGAD